MSILAGRMLEVTRWNMPSMADRAEADLHYYQDVAGPVVHRHCRRAPLTQMSTRITERFEACATFCNR